MTPELMKERNVLFKTHSTRFIYDYTVEGHSDREREETRYRHMGYFFRLAARVLLYAHTTTFVTSVVKHRLKGEIAQWVHHKYSIRQSIPP